MKCKAPLCPSCTKQPLDAPQSCVAMHLRVLDFVLERNPENCSFAEHLPITAMQLLHGYLKALLCVSLYFTRYRETLETNGFQGMSSIPYLTIP